MTLCIVQVYSYGYQPVQYLQPVQYVQPVQSSYYQQPSYTTAKPYYPSSSEAYYTTTVKPYYPTTTYPTTAYYSTTYPTTSYYTTKAYETPSYYQPPTTSYYQTTKAYYEQPSYTTPGYYPDNYDGNENVRNLFDSKIWIYFLTLNAMFILRDGTITPSNSTSTIMEMNNREAKLTRIPLPEVSTLSVCPMAVNKSSITKPTKTDTGLKSRTSRQAAISTATRRIITAHQSMDHPYNFYVCTRQTYCDDVFRSFVQLTLFSSSRMQMNSSWLSSSFFTFWLLMISIACRCVTFDVLTVCIIKQSLYPADGFSIGVV